MGPEDRPLGLARDEEAPSSLAMMRPANPGAIAEIRHAAIDFAAAHGAGADLLDDLALAVSEATTNAVKHAQTPAIDGVVEMAASVSGSWLELRIRDRGLGFGTQESDGLGLGLPLIASLASELRIRQEGHGTEVQMRFVIGP